jgi:6-bladed beta-propeller
MSPKHTLMALGMPAAFFFSGCIEKDGHGSANDSTPAVSVAENLRIGTPAAEGPGSFSSITALTVDRAGRIYILDREAQEIRVFDSTGVFLRIIGRKGSGPGEFRDAIGFDWDLLGRLWIVDQQNARYTVTDTAGKILGEYHRPISGFYTYSWSGGLDGAGHIYEFYQRPGLGEELLLRYDEKFGVPDTIPLPHYEGGVFKLQRPNARTFAKIPFGPSLVWTLDRAGFIWFGVTDTYRLYKRDLKGDTISGAGRPYAPVPVTSVERDSAIGALEWFTRQGGQVDVSRIPRRKPAFLSIFVDDQERLWVLPTAGESTSGSILDVFDASGNFVRRWRTDFRVTLHPLPLVRGSRLYSVTQDSDGINYVVRADLRER